MVEEYDSPCHNPYDFGDADQYEQNGTWVGNNIKSLLSQDSKKHSEHKENCNGHWKSKVSFEPSPERKIKAGILFIKALWSIIISQSVADDPSGDKQYDKLIVVCELILKLAELFLEGFAWVRFANGFCLVDWNIK